MLRDGCGCPQGRAEALWMPRNLWCNFRGAPDTVEALDEAMLLTRQGDLLILRSRTTALWGGLFFAGASAVLLYVLVSRESGGLVYWLVVALAAGLVAVAAFMMLPQSVTTIFDPTNAQV